MRIALFGYPGDALYRAVSRGIRREGHELVEQVLSCFQPAQPLRGIEAALVCGEVGLAQDAAEFYRVKRGIPCELVRPGYLTHPKDDQYRFGERLAADSDAGRLKSFGLKLRERTRVKGQSVLVLGQKTGDPRHGMNRAQFEEWANSVVLRVRAVETSKILWRPHPADVWNLPGADDFSDPRRDSLEDAFARSWLVVTFNSSQAIDALTEGLPVIAEGKAPYLEVAGSLADLKNAKPPGEKALGAVLGRIAASQFSLAELAEGGPIASFLRTSESEQVEPASVDSDQGGPLGDSFAEIKGVGPVAERVLREAGILTFEELAGAQTSLLDSLGLPGPSLRALRDWRGEGE